MSDVTQYPEHDKLRAVVDRSQAIGEFIEWLGTTGRFIAHRRTFDLPCIFCDGGTRHGKPCSRCDGTGWRPGGDSETVHDPTPIPTLLAGFFGIDQAKLEDEKRAMLDKLRAQHEAVAS